MVTRKSLTVNNGAALKRTKLFQQSGLSATTNKNAGRQLASIRTFKGYGRPVDEGYGGGTRYGKKTS